MIIRRLLQVPLILLAVYAITFALVWLIPGNPMEQGEGRRPPAEIVEAMNAQYRLDDWRAFSIDYLGKASGIHWLLGRAERPFDLGPSLRHENWSVNEILAAGLPVSMALGAIAIVLALGIGIGAGVVAARRPGSAMDSAALALALIGISLPSFVVGSLLLIVFAVALRWFPVGGWGGPEHLVLPSVALALPIAAWIARLTRTGMIEQRESLYVRAARARGLTERAIILRHVLPNALLPVLSYIGPAAAMAMTGSFVVEKVFAVPGIGTHFVDAVLSKDITLIMGVVLTYAALLVIFNLIVDVLYRWVDPRTALPSS